MTQLPSAAAIQARFNGVTLTNDGVRFILNQRSNEFWVRMESAAPSAPGSPAPDPVDVPIGLVTGSHHMQVFWVPNGIGNCQIGFPFTWLIPEQRWVPRNSTFIRPPDTVHKPETWNLVCIRCHSTGAEPQFDRAERTFQTRVGEMGISCEACHGPAEQHVAIAQNWKKETAANSAAPPPANWSIVHPEKIDPKRASQLCGFCHSMKWFDDSTGWNRDGFRYRPGDDLEATTPIMRPKELDKQPWLQKALANSPNLFNDFFWTDGMIRVSGREYNGLLESPCYPGSHGKFSCISCHSLHQSEPADLLSKNRQDNRACTQCHESYRDESRLAAHTRHLAQSSGSLCYNCHMPHTTYGVLQAIRSHQISTPNPNIDLKIGRPNACNLCHLNQTLEWTATKLHEWRPGSRQTQALTNFPPISEAIRLALSGDAGQRALAAWHLGWKPAVEASQAQHWAPIILGQLLDDPYAAIRCVAERSLKQLGNALPAGYDYTVSPDSRPPVRFSLFDRHATPALAHLQQNPTHAIHVPRVALPADSQPSESSRLRMGLEEIRKQRSENPVRLRE